MNQLFNTLHGKPDRADNPLSKVYEIYGIMIIIVVKVKTLLACSHPYVAQVRGFSQIQHSEILVVMQSRSQVMMLLFSACANTPEVRFVENNDDDGEERTAFLDSGHPQEARVNRAQCFSNRCKNLF